MDGSGIAMGPRGATPPSHAALDLFLLSLLALYTELVVIRWLASEVRVFAYFKNLPLMASFLGLGLGCARGSAGRLARWFPALFGGLCLLIAFSGPLGLIHLRFPDRTLALWRADAVLPAAQAAIFVGAILAIFFWVVATFAALGERLATLFDAFPPLTAYSINVVGSLAGIALFSLFSLVQTGPIVWIAVASLLSLRFDHRARSLAVLAGVLGLVALAPRADFWSPYYRIDFHPIVLRLQGELIPVGYSLAVNHDYHQRALDLSAELLRSRPWLAAHGELRRARFSYDMPYALAPAHDRVLVVGAGTGNDVAAALRHGARQVDAVEIDPTILQLGKRYHPERPYESPAVHAINTDARAFFRQTDGRYDLIVFGLLDSHTMFSSLSSLRLDNYVYTVESLREALLAHLNPRGVLAVTFSTVAGDWIGERLAATLKEAAGTEPLAIETGYDAGVSFFAGPGLERTVVDRLPGLARWTPEVGSAAAARPATDDWPFLYLRPGSRPTAYVLVLGAILLGAWLTVRGAFRGTVAFDEHLFFLGAAFMLVEVKSVAELSLLFGSTWLVNSAVFTGILLMILAANGTVSRLRPATPAAWYAGLAASLLIPLTVPLAALNVLSFVTRAAAATLVVSLPIFFGGIIFALSFRTASRASTGLAANLFGAVVGGTLEYLSMLFGIRSLNLLALVLYGASCAVLIRRPNR